VGDHIYGDVWDHELICCVPQDLKVYDNWMIYMWVIWSVISGGFFGMKWNYRLIVNDQLIKGKQMYIARHYHSVNSCGSKEAIESIHQSHYSNPSVYEQSVYKFSLIQDAQINTYFSIYEPIFAYMSSFLSQTDHCSQLLFSGSNGELIFALQVFALRAVFEERIKLVSRRITVL
jgi:hypothetical protein